MDGSFLKRALPQKGFVRIAVLAAAAGVGVASLVAHRAMETRDLRHGRFYHSGKTINAFLSSYCEAFEAAHAGAEPAPLLALYSEAFRAPRRGRLAWGPEERLGGVAVQSRRAAGGGDVGRAELAAELTAGLAELAAVESTVCKIDLIEELDPELRARLTVKLIVDGVDRQGRVLQDRLFHRWHLVHDPAAYAWRIERDELVEGVRVAAAAPEEGAGDVASGLSEVDPEALGIDFRHRRDPRLDMKKYRSELKFGVIQHASGGLSAADYDQDGRPDLLFLDGRSSRLYRNQGTVPGGSVRFVDVTAEVGLAGLDRAHAGLFADFDNDGDRDLFVSRYLAPNRFFRNDGNGIFHDASSEMGLDATLPSASATALDFDRDGDLDLYLAVYGNAFEALPRLPFFARNGEPNRLYRNESGKRFVDVTAASGTGDTGWSLAVAAADYDGDGWPDLAVANDFGRKNLYRNDGPGADGTVTFSEVAQEAGVLDFGFGMGLAFGDVDDDGRPDLYTSNVNSNQRWFGEDITVGRYLRNFLRTRWAVADALELWSLYRTLEADWSGFFLKVGDGNSLFRNRGDGSFEELEDSHANRAGWGWGVAFFDLDNDTEQDLYAANGWISNTPGTDL